MSGHTSPNDPKKFTAVLFTGIVVAFVFAMLMMLWQGDFEHDEHGERHYNTTVVEPGY
ncbi:hypothetical protein [Parafilimonas terrae]|uniref:Uncharacterized protein n=1 Tax=Parafilimonas terrae TaxID=1465490 RepID=A0A1I5SD31_9BACT|nr:hypothetical protein [Parafilimonas terrae]SFP68603.1 hypothetical protein SAMN05444277_101707 [Parafilimonas terrae]